MYSLYHWDFFLLSLDNFRQIWTSLDKFRLIWTSSDQFGQVQTNFRSIFFKVLTNLNLPPIFHPLLFQCQSRGLFQIELQPNLPDILDFPDPLAPRTCQILPDPPGPPGTLRPLRSSRIPYLPPIYRSLLFQFQSKGFFQIELQLRKLHKICHPIATTNRFQTFPKDYWHCHLTQWTKTENYIRKNSHFLVTTWNIFSCFW